MRICTLLANTDFSSTEFIPYCRNTEFIPYLMRRKTIFLRIFYLIEPRKGIPFLSPSFERHKNKGIEKGIPLRLQTNEEDSVLPIK